MQMNSEVKFLHTLKRVICGSQIRALPQGTEVAGLIPARSLQSKKRDAAKALTGLL